MQLWGTSSKKGNDLYLFVFDQPPGGTLVIGDLQSDPKSVTLMGASGALPMRRIDADHVQITLPPVARKAEIPVVKVTFDGAVKTGGALPLSRDQANAYRIFDAKLAGGVGYGSNTYARAGSTIWMSNEGRVSWPVIARPGGKYQVSATYNLVKGIGGGTMEINLGDKSLQHVVETGETTPDLHKGDVITREIGTIEVPAGRHELSINALNIPAGGELARFIGVTLTSAR